MVVGGFAAVAHGVTQLTQDIDICCRMTPDNLRMWLHNPPGVKPGSKMPNLGLSSTEITNLVAYLQTLK